VENTIHILLKCAETKRWMYQFLMAEWLKVNVEVAYRKIVGCNNVNKLRGFGKYLYGVRCKWENEISNNEGEWRTVGVELSQQEKT
jgi:hypothetical protein